MTDRVQQYVAIQQEALKVFTDKIITYFDTILHSQLKNGTAPTELLIIKQIADKIKKHIFVSNTRIDLIDGEGDGDGDGEGEGHGDGDDTKNESMRSVFMDVYNISAIMAYMFIYSNFEGYHEDSHHSYVEFYKTMQRDAIELFTKKNADYGDAFATYGLIGVIVRIGDKLNRLLTISVSGTQIDDETLADTLIDLHNYSAMAIMLLDE